MNIATLLNGNPISAAIGAVGTLIDRLVPDPKAAAEAKKELTLIADAAAARQDQLVAEQLKAQRDILVAEAGSEGSLTRNARPAIALALAACVVNQYLAVPYLAMLGLPVPNFVVPDAMWELMSVYMTGYVVSKGVERVADAVKTGIATRAKK